MRCASRCLQTCCVGCGEQVTSVTASLSLSPSGLWRKTKRKAKSFKRQSAAPPQLSSFANFRTQIYGTDITPPTHHPPPPPPSRPLLCAAEGGCREGHLRRWMGSLQKHLHRAPRCLPIEVRLPSIRANSLFDKGQTHLMILIIIGVTVVVAYCQDSRLLLFLFHPEVVFNV